MYRCSVHDSVHKFSHFNNKDVHIVVHVFVKLIYSFLCTVFSFHFSCATLFPLENTEAGRVFISRVSWTKNVTKAPSPHFIYFIICGLPGFKGIQGTGMFTQVHLSPEYHSEWSSLSPPLPSYHVNGLRVDDVIILLLYNSVYFHPPANLT